MEFKKLSAVEAVEAVSDTASVLIEENGVIKRAPKDEVGGLKVDELEVVEEPAESANVLIEENGIVKKAPKSAVGGTGGLPYHVRVRYDVNTQTYSCDLDYDDVYELMKTGVLLYATIEVNYSGEYEIAPDRGYYYCNNSAMPDGDVVYFEKLGGSNVIIFYDGGGISVS